MLSHRYIRSQFRALIHELPAIGSFTEARNFQVITLIWIKQVIVPVHTTNGTHVLPKLNIRTSDLNQNHGNSLKENERGREGGRGRLFQSYVSSLPAETSVLAMRTIRFSTSPTLIILA